VNRTYQDKDLFQTTFIKELLVNILFIWSKENREISYKQGMNEILAVILFGLYPFYFPVKNKETQENILKYLKNDKEKYAKDIYLFFHDQDDLASDLFFLFDAVMNKGIKDLYDNGSNKKKDLMNYKKYDLFQPQWAEEDDSEKVKIHIYHRINYLCKEDAH
jgi:TBC1 domain family protein 5